MNIPCKVKLLWIGLILLAGLAGIFIGDWLVVVAYVLLCGGWGSLVELFESGRGTGVFYSLFPDWSGNWVGNSKSALLWLEVISIPLSIYMLGQGALKLWRYIVVNKWKSLTCDEARWFELTSGAWYYLKRHERIELRELEKRLGLPSSLPDHLHDEP